MMFQVSDLGASCCKIQNVLVPNNANDRYQMELPREKKVKMNNPETKAYSSSAHSCFESHVTALDSHADALYFPLDFRSSDSIEKSCRKKCSPKRIISSYSSREKRFVTFTLAPVDVRHCRLRLPIQFTRENGINKPGKIYLLGKDGSKWLANLLLESRGRMTLGDGWKSFVKANGLKIGESYTLELHWEDTTPVLSLCTAEYSIDKRAGGGCSVASEKDPFPTKPSSINEIIKDLNKKDVNIDETSKEESRSWEREKNHLRCRESTSPSQNRFVTLTITPDSLRHGRLRLPLHFMWENSMNTPGDIVLLGKDGAKWLVSLLLERRGRMCLGKGWKDFAKENGLKTGDSITLESIWEDMTPALSLFRIEFSNNDRKQVDVCSKAREEESNFTDPCLRNKINKAENNGEESRKYPLTRIDSSLAIQNQFATSALSPEGVCCGKIVVFRDDGDMMFHIPDLGPRFCENQELASSRNNEKDNTGSIAMKKQPQIRKERCFSPYDGDDHYNIELPRKKKMKKNNPEIEADSSPDRSCFVAHVTTSNLHTDTMYLPQDFTSSDGLERKCRKKYNPTQIISSYSSSEKQLATFTLAPIDVRNCRLRLPMQFTRENGINKPGKIYLLGKDGSKWLANLLVESRGRMTLGDGWKSFVKANGLKTGESFALKLNWEDTTPVLSLCTAEYNFDSREGGCSESIEKEPLPVETSSRTENSKDDHMEDENRKEESSSWDRDKNHLRWRDSTSTSKSQFVTLTITPDSLKHGRLRLPLPFMMENNMNKPGEITLLGKDGSKWLVSLLLEKRGRMSLGKGWKDFAKANGLNTGDSITFESIWEAATPVLSLLRVESSNDRTQGGFLEQSISTRPKAENNRERCRSGEMEKTNYLHIRRESSQAAQDRVVVLTLTPEDVRECKLQLPSQFMRTNGMEKLGKITLLGRSGMKWFAYLLSKDGIVALGNGWKGFCEANGVMLGESFLLEYIPTPDTTTHHVLRFCSNFG